MPRRVFYSFHYKPDVTRVAKIRNIGVIEGNPRCTDNEWESITRGGEKAIKAWIDNQILGKSCAIVMVGTETAQRKWIDYEIEKAWGDRKGVLGIYIHNISNLNGDLTFQGSNPFSHLQLGGNPFSSIAPTYNPPYQNSRDNYNYIANHIEDWIEQAISIRNQY